MSLRPPIAFLALSSAAFACSSDDGTRSLPTPEATGGAAGGTATAGGGAEVANTSAVDTTASLDAGMSVSNLDGGAQRDPRPDLDGGASTDAGLSVYEPDWCARAGADEASRPLVFFGVAFAFDQAQSMDCATAGLTSSFDGTQAEGWASYLIDYSLAMAGCPLEFPVDGGILVFGPGNTPAVGALRPDLGADDVERLTTHYVAAFGDALGLDEDERALVRDHLLLTAQADINPAASGVLSICGDSADAGL
jgi:hypothetical protein